MNKKIAVLLKIFISLGLMTFLISQVDFRQIFSILKNVDIIMIFYALIMLIIQAFVATARWQFVLNCQKIKISYKNILKILWSGLFFNQAMPSSVGGDVIRGYYLKKEGMSLGRATLGVLMDRLFGMMGLVILVLISLPLLFELVDDTTAQTGILFIALSASIALMIILFTDKLPGNFSHLKLIEGFYSLSKDTRHCIVKNHCGLIIIPVSILIHIISVTTVMIIAAGLNLNVDLWGGLLIFPLVSLMLVAPISIAGWGVREGAMVVGFGYLGVAPEAALALSILYGLSALIVALPGGVVWALKRNHTPN